MASVFLSYDREDAERGAARSRWRSRKAGHTVWWDLPHPRAARNIECEIERALKEADAVVVLWSERSIESAWVRDEAAAGRDSGRLVPVTARAGAKPPMGFRQFQNHRPFSAGRAAGNRRQKWPDCWLDAIRRASRQASATSGARSNLLHPAPTANRRHIESTWAGWRSESSCRARDRPHCLTPVGSRGGTGPLSLPPLRSAQSQALCEGSC